MKTMMAKSKSTLNTPRSRSGVKQVIKKAANAVGKQIAKSTISKARMGMSVYGKSGSDMSNSDTMMAKGGAKKSTPMMKKNKTAMYRRGGATSKMKKGGC